MHNTNPLRTDLPRFSQYDSVEKVVSSLSGTMTHIPVFEEDRLLGMLSMETISSVESKVILSELFYELEHFSVQTDTHWQEVLEVFGRYDTDIVPVLNADGNYTGYFLLIDFIHLFAETPFLRESGSFIILEKNTENYSFSEISQIVESSRSALLGIFVSEIGAGKTQLTLKVSTDTLSEMLHNFRRYGYTIVLDKEDDLYLNELKEKSDYFNKYLTM